MASQTDTYYTKGDQYDGFVHTFNAEAAISKNQIVELGTAYPQVVVHTANADRIIVGVALSNATAGQEIPVMCTGPVKNVIAGEGFIVRGELVYPDGTTAGSCDSIAAANGTTLRAVIGVALESGDTKGEKVPVLCGWPGIVLNS